MITVSDVIGKALLLGACDNSHKATDWKSLCWLFFSPQGREFCRKSNYPSIEMFRSIKSNIHPYGVYVEEKVNEHNKDVALIGKSESEISFSGVDKAYKVILMHGAKAVIHAGDYAVVRVENISGEYELINDGTAKILI